MKMNVTVIRKPGATSLSVCEVAVLKLLAEGLQSKEIGKQLGIATKTVEKHRANLMKKLGIRNAVNLTHYAIAKGVTTVKPFNHLPDHTVRVE